MTGFFPMSEEQKSVALNTTNAISLLTIAFSCVWFASAQAQEVSRHAESIKALEARLRNSETQIQEVSYDVRWIRKHLETANKH